MTVLSNSDAIEEDATARIRSLCYTCHADGGMIPDYDLSEINENFIVNLVANFDYAGHVTRQVAECCVILAEEVGRFRFLLAMRWQSRCEDPIVIQQTILKACQKRPTSTEMAQDLITLLGPTQGNLDETDRVIRQWAKDVYLAELAAFKSFESASLTS